MGAVALFGVLGLVAPIAVALGVWTETSVVPIGSSVVVLLAAGAITATTCGMRPRTNVVDVATWVYVYVFLGLAPLAQRIANRFPWNGRGLRADDLWMADVIVLVGLVAYLAGRGLVLVTPMPSWRLTLRAGRLRFWALVAAIASTSVFFALFGFDAVVTDRTTHGLEFSALHPSSSVVLIAQSLLKSPLIAFLPALVLVLPRARRSRGMLVTVLLLVIVANAAMNNFINAARYTAGTVIIASVVAFVLRSPRTRRLLAAFPIALVIGLTLVFPVADLFRHAAETVRIAPISEQLVLNGDYDSFQQLANTVAAVDSLGVARGENLLGAAGFWVPREAWPGKPRPTGEIVAAHAGFRYLNLSAPIWAEGYFAAGLPGVFILLALWGVVAATADRAVARFGDPARSDPTFSVVAAVLLAGYALFLLRGPLMSTFAYFVPILLVALLMTSLRKGSREGTAA